MKTFSVQVSTIVPGTMAKVLVYHTMILADRIYYLLLRKAKLDISTRNSRATNHYDTTAK